jgi:hypothetical protein
MTTLQGATPNGSVRRWQRRSAIHHLVPSRPAGHATWSNSGISGGGEGVPLRVEPHFRGLRAEVIGRRSAYQARNRVS